MKQMILRWTAGVIAILITVWIASQLPGRGLLKLHWHLAWSVIIFVPVLAVVNAVIGPVIKLLALPINCLTFGLFSFVVNAVLFWLAGRATGGDMNVLGALFGSVVYAVLSTVLSWPLKENDA